MAGTLGKRDWESESFLLAGASCTFLGEGDWESESFLLAGASCTFLGEIDWESGIGLEESSSILGLGFIFFDSDAFCFCFCFFFSKVGFDSVDCEFDKGTEADPQFSFCGKFEQGYHSEIGNLMNVPSLWFGLRAISWDLVGGIVVMIGAKTSGIDGLQTRSSSIASESGGDG